MFKVNIIIWAMFILFGMLPLVFSITYRYFNKNTLSIKLLTASIFSFVCMIIIMVIYHFSN